MKSLHDKQIEAIFFQDYYAKDVHQVYPWIGGTTFVKRVRSGRLPILNRPGKDPKGRVKGIGTGTSYRLDFGGLVHTGVDDEVIACGVRGDVGTVEYEFIAENGDTDYHTQKPPEGGLAELIFFYRHYKFQVTLTIDLEHERKPGSSEIFARNKRGQRKHHINVHPMRMPFRMGCEVHRLVFSPDGYAVTVFSSIRISVYEIYNYVLDRLGLNPPSIFDGKSSAEEAPE